MTERARWTCPECGTRVTGFGPTQDVADGGVVAVVREHMAAAHPGALELANPVAAASWLHGTGELVELWGGPHDGATLWCPPGELPDVIGAHLTADGAVIPVRSVRPLPHVVPYRLGETAAARACGRRVRYLYDSRPR